MPSTDPVQLPRLLDANALADRLGVEVCHIRRLVHERRIPFIKWGQRLHFDRAAVDAWVDEHRISPEAS